MQQVLAATPHNSTNYTAHLPPITKTIQTRRTRHAGHWWRSKDELVSDVLLWTSAYGQSKAGRPGRKYIQQLSEDTGCNPEDLPEAMNDWETWRERVRDIRAGCSTWWWWSWWDPIWCYHSMLELTWKQWQWRGILHSQKSSITEGSPSDCLVSYPEHSLGGSLPFSRHVLSPQRHGYSYGI